MLGKFHQNLTDKTNAFVHLVYDISKSFPREEMFGVTGQLRRAALSVALNYREGYGRYNQKELKRFLKIANGSLKESLYLVRFAHDRKWVDDVSLQKTESIGDELGRMFWSIFSQV